MEDGCHGDVAEPQRKRRCLRFSSAEEDALIVSDSGFGDLSSEDDHTHSSSSSLVSVTFGGAATASSQQLQTQQQPQLPPPSFSNYHQINTNALPPPEELLFFPEDVPVVVEEECLNKNNSTSSSIGAEEGQSSSSSSSSSSSEEQDDSSSLDDSFLDLLLNSSEICGNPGRAAMIQRFISHLRSNPGDAQLQHFLALLLSGPEFSPPRHRLRHVTSLHDAVRLMRVSKRILVLTGAGISVSCGIPDFRSKDGLYSRVAKVFPELRDPQSVFDIRLFRRDPRPFFLTAKELYPGQFAPSPSHRFIRKLESRGQLLRNYSQNIDTLEQIAGIERVTMCHGSFATATCIRCGIKVQADAIKEKVLAGEVPFCGVCSSPEETKNITFPLGSSTESQQQVGRRRGTFDDEDDEEDDEFSNAGPPNNFPLPPVVKPDIVFFGEDLPDEFHANLQVDKPQADLVVVIGSSLRVRPVSLIPGMVPSEVPQILINRESLPHCRFDVELLGNCDSILAHLASLLGPDFEDVASGEKLKELEKLPPKGMAGVDLLADGENALDSQLKVEVEEPKSEHDIQALKACWEPKTNEKVTDRLPRGSYLRWRPRQYIFEGAEESYDPDDDEEDDDSSPGSSSSSSSDSESSNDEEDQQQQKQQKHEGGEKATSLASLSSQSNQQ